MTNDDSLLEKRITQLEELVMHQDRLIQDLNHAVRELHDELAKRSRLVEAKVDRLEGQLEQLNEPFDPNEKPPHY